MLLNPQLAHGSACSLNHHVEHLPGNFGRSATTFATQIMQFNSWQLRTELLRIKRDNCRLNLAILNQQATNNNFGVRVRWLCFDLFTGRFRRDGAIDIVFQDIKVGLTLIVDFEKHLRRSDKNLIDNNRILGDRLDIYLRLNLPQGKRIGLRETLGIRHTDTGNAAFTLC